MFNTSPYTLKLLAALVWYSGAVVLYIKSASMLFRAEMINPGQHWIWMAVLSGLVIGGIKAKYLFKRLCFKNLARINALQQTKLWHFYRIRFFIFPPISTNDRLLTEKRWHRRSKHSPGASWPVRSTRQSKLSRSVAA